MSDSILKISDLSVSFAGTTVINGFSLTLEKGQKIIVAGPNGSGKTTLLKCILGSLRPEKGSISISKDVNMAYCKQDFPDSRFPISSQEVVEMGLYRTKSKDLGIVRHAMEMTETSHLARRSFYSLSGGERQRVNLARCFCQNANLLLFDEPSSFLDLDSRNSFISIMKDLPKDIAAIVVTHDNDLFDGLTWPVIRIGEVR